MAVTLALRRDGAGSSSCSSTATSAQALRCPARSALSASAPRPGSARDITCIFLAMTLGLATGMGYIGIAVMTGVVMCLLLLVYAAMSFGRRPEEEKELKITIPENLDYTGLFDDLFAQYTRASELISVRTTGMGSLYNLHYHVTLVSSEVEKQFLDAIRCRNGNLDIVCGKVPQAKEAL